MNRLRAALLASYDSFTVWLALFIASVTVALIPELVERGDWTAATLVLLIFLCVYQIARLHAKYPPMDDN